MEVKIIATSFMQWISISSVYDYREALSSLCDCTISCVCWENELVEINTRLGDYFTAVIFLHVSYKMQSKLNSLSNKLFDLLATNIGHFLVTPRDVCSSNSRAYAFVAKQSRSVDESRSKEIANALKLKRPERYSNSKQIYATTKCIFIVFVYVCMLAYLYTSLRRLLSKLGPKPPTSSIWSWLLWRHQLRSIARDLWNGAAEASGSGWAQCVWAW